MEREIKFRIWDKIIKGFTFRGLLTQLPPPPPEYIKDLVFQQFTGLKDKNGREVYEGDIIKYTRFNWKCSGHPSNSTDLMQFCEVYWCDEYHAFRERGGYGKNCGGWSGSLLFKDSRAERNEIKIIGNIYENPELLKKTVDNS